MAKGILVSHLENGITNFWFICPGCGYGHTPVVEGKGAWQWNGSLDAPTISPSILVNQHDPKQRCHSFVRDGKIEFLNDCFHELAGQTVELPEWED